LPDAIIWASAEVTERLVVTRGRRFSCRSAQSIPLPRAVDINEMTNRGWTAGDSLPPDFFYGPVARPHLHLTCTAPQGGSANGPWNVAYLGYTPQTGNAIVIYRVHPAADNQAAITNLPAIGNHTAAQVQAEATFVYNSR
jgi:hypothetical protein